ncbi:unnamed protein product [Caenorhabditis angaria]|uniref:T20D4.11-like domain-containing protein n=1 Tax=Caenorhabditis angaria TaxID=860376 RepID=A0A9P1IX54_9PELO|nr:unnamed protein product [Caenorhabditis angaria]
MAQADSGIVSNFDPCPKKIMDLEELLRNRNPTDVASWYKQTALLCEEAEDCMYTLIDCPKYAEKTMKVIIRCKTQRSLAQDDFIDCSVLLKGKPNHCMAPLAKNKDCDTWKMVVECESEHVAKICGEKYVPLFMQKYEAAKANDGC